MADYYTNFSCELDVLTAENAALAMQIFAAMSSDDDGFTDPNFQASVDEARPSVLWLREDVTGDPDAVAEFVRQCCQKLVLTGLWGFEWANTCSRSLLGAFGGGAYLIDLATGEIIECVTTNHWLSERVEQGGDHAADR